MPKNVWTTAQLHSSHMLGIYCSKFSKPGFNSTWTMNFKMFKLDLAKAEEPEIKLPTSVGSLKKQEFLFVKIDRNTNITVPTSKGRLASRLTFSRVRSVLPSLV